MSRRKRQTIETHAHVVKDLRMWADDINRASPDGESAAKLRDWADRFEAAHQREVTEAATIAATQPRNCDVGTADEQEDRYVRFCNSHYKNHGNCFGCAALKPRGRCEFAWENLPYESEAKK